MCSQRNVRSFGEIENLLELFEQRLYAVKGVSYRQIRQEMRTSEQ